MLSQFDPGIFLHTCTRFHSLFWALSLNALGSARLPPFCSVKMDSTAIAAFLRVL